MEYADLTNDDVDELAADREYLSAVMRAHYPEVGLTGGAADIAWMQRVLDEGPYTEDAAYESISLGTSFGDVLARELALHWVHYSDDDGVELALRYGSSSIILFPRSMILKRVEGGERLDLKALFDQIAPDVRQLARKQNH